MWGVAHFSEQRCFSILTHAPRTRACVRDCGLQLGWIDGLTQHEFAWYQP